jgi:hypothetical protein
MMKSRIQKGVSILKDEGMTELFRKIFQTYDPRYFVYKIKGSQAISVRSEKANVKIDDIGAYNELQFIKDNEKPIINDIIKNAKKEDVFFLI